MNRVRAGFLLTRNPFNAHQITRVSLLPQDVDVIVFWTRNPDKLLPLLPELDDLGYRYYFQFTITGYPKVLEKSVPNPNRAVEIFKSVSKHVGAGRIVWRYDPILLSSQVDIAEHKRLFCKLAGLLEGYAKRVVVSFADFYKKTERNLKAVGEMTYSDIVQQQSSLTDLAQYLAITATQHDLQIASCSESVDLESLGIRHGKCIDDQLIREEFGISVDSKKDKGQRDECGCVKSIDIGQYNTCLHGCAYCYATFNSKSVEANRRKHDPNSPFLVGALESVDAKLVGEEIPIQGSLF